MVYLSHAMCAHAYDLAISSSAFRLLALLRDCARSEMASSRSSGGRGVDSVGTRPLSVWTMDLSILLDLMTDTSR